MSYVFMAAKGVITDKDNMTTVTETAVIHTYPSLESLIEQLNKVKAQTNNQVHIHITGDKNTGFRINLSWDRPMTDDEITRNREYEHKSLELLKEERRKEYEKLKAEFENGSN
jgi:diadenosine tetraphosphate (Ap4A) HIT family hydrolase